MRVPVPERTYVTVIWYNEKSLTSVLQHCAEMGSWTGVRGFHQLHDIAPDHHSAMLIEYLEERHIETFTVCRPSIISPWKSLRLAQLIG